MDRLRKNISEIKAFEIGKNSDIFVADIFVKAPYGLVEINNIVFDRSGYRYHGRVKAIADILRENKINL